MTSKHEPNDDRNLSMTIRLDNLTYLCRNIRLCDPSYRNIIQVHELDINDARSLLYILVGALMPRKRCTVCPHVTAAWITYHTT